jgi:hypothetical protein
MVKIVITMLIIISACNLGLFLVDITSKVNQDKNVFSAATALTNFLMMGVTLVGGISLIKFKKYSDAVCVLGYFIVVGSLVYQSYKFPIGNEENEPHLSEEYKKTRRDFRNAI